MSGKSVKQKGANGEREAAKLLQQWLRPVYEYADVDMPELSRNLEQTRGGGYDLSGWDWLAVEVKRHEQLSLPSWWRQTLRQASPEQLPLLMYRQNRKSWCFRTKVDMIYGGSSSTIVVDLLDQDAAKHLLRCRCYSYLASVS